jgi:hypothetical protein
VPLVRESDRQHFFVEPSYAHCKLPACGAAGLRPRWYWVPPPAAAAAPTPTPTLCPRFPLPHAGEVYIARWKEGTDGDVRVAVKPVGVLTADAVAVRRHREVWEAAAAHRHPHLLPVLGACVDAPDGRLRLVMRVLEKGNLEAYLALARLRVCVCVRARARALKRVRAAGIPLVRRRLADVLAC